jgi:Icc-related predicted phosphoesterase
LNPRGEISPAQSGSFTIVAFGDSKGRTAVWGRALADARRTHADALVVLGDLVEQNSDFEFRWAAEHVLGARSAELPVYVAIGNHEGFDRGGNLSRDRYQERFGPPVSWFRSKGVLIVSIDSADERSFSVEQAREVEAILAAERPRSAHAVVLTHVPPLAGEPLKDKRGYVKMLDPADSTRLLDLADRFDVDLVLAGHYHGFAERKRGKTRIVISGGGGGSLDSPDAFFHYVRATLPPQGGVNLEIVRVDDAPGLEHARYLLLRNEQRLLVVAGALAVASLGLGLFRARRKPA